MGESRHLIMLVQVFIRYKSNKNRLVGVYLQINKLNKLCITSIPTHGGKV